MAVVSRAQSTFLGGEWSPYAQGRFDHAGYKTALNVCLNSHPITEGAWTRRPGFQFLGLTKGGAKARTIAFDFSEIASFFMELSTNNLRFYAGTSRVHTADEQVVSAISTATPAVITTATSPIAWPTGSVVEFIFQGSTNSAVGAPLQNRQFTVTNIDNVHYSLFDMQTGAPINGATLNWVAPFPAQLVVGRVLDLATPYNGTDWQQVRKVQAANVTSNPPLADAILLHNLYPPQTVAENAPNIVTPRLQQFSIGASAFVNGPYLDPVNNSPTGNTIQPSNSAGATLVAATTGNINGGTGFVATDVGRMLRMFSEPVIWNIGVTYPAGQYVKYLGAYYLSGVGSNLGNIPNISPSDWIPVAASTATVWVWGKITAVTNTTTVSFSIQPNPDGVPATLAYFAQTAVTTWALGAYSATTGYPSCGCYYQGRLVLSGAIGNRIDASVTNSIFDFSPTDTFGNVLGSSAIASTYNADNTNTVYWIEDTAAGLIAATKTGQWLINAPTLGPWTSTNQAASRVTKVKAGNLLPAHTPLTLVAVDKFGLSMFEFYPDVFSGRIQAPNLNAFAQHITVPGVLEIDYQSDILPVVWGRRSDGGLIGCTYCRERLYSADPPTFSGFHRHALGNGHTVESVSVSPNALLTQDTLRMVEFDSVQGFRHVTTSRPLFKATDALTSAWFVDDGVVPSGAQQSTVGGVSGITFFGLWHLNGETASAVIGGLDCGDYLVGNGSIFVPFGSDPAGNFKLSYLQSLSQVGGYGDMSVLLDSPAYTFPAVVGLTYTSQGQMLRALKPEEAGARTGPGLGMTRRTHMFSSLFGNMIPGTVSFGTTFSDLRPCTPTFPGGSALPTTSMYSGVFWGTLDDDYSFDSQLCWQITRPLPLTIAALDSFAHTQER
jgi:hypothetical protein